MEAALETVFVDPEPPGPAGGGIRTYIRLALGICDDAGVPALVYTHAPEAFPGRDARPIGRKPWLNRPWRGLMYRLDYHGNALWEHSRWLADELERTHVPGRAYEFADFQGYAWHSLRSPALRRHCVVRVHTPAYLTIAKPDGLRRRLAAALLAYRERDCLMGRAEVVVPSAAFAAEKLPWLKGAEHLPNPLPPAPPRASAGGTGPGVPEAGPGVPEAGPGVPEAGPGVPEAGPGVPEAGPGIPEAGPGIPEAGPGIPEAGPGVTGTGPRFLYLGRIEARKGVLTLLAGFLRLAKQDPGPTLTLAGADVQPYAGKVRALLEACPEELRVRVHWEPPCPPEARDALLARHDALATPSLWENSPYAYFEGMAAGLLCVASATGEMKEVAAATGGPVGAPGDPDDWTRALGEAAAICRDPGRRAAALAAQSAYLEERRAAIPPRLLALWRKLAEAP